MEKVKGINENAKQCAFSNFIAVYIGRRLPVLVFHNNFRRYKYFEPEKSW